MATPLHHGTTLLLPLAHRGSRLATTTSSSGRVGRRIHQIHAITTLSAHQHCPRNTRRRCRHHHCHNPRLSSLSSSTKSSRLVRDGSSSILVVGTRPYSHSFRLKQFPKHNNEQYRSIFSFLGVGSGDSSSAEKIINDDADDNSEDDRKFDRHLQNKNDHDYNHRNGHGHGHLHNHRNSSVRMPLRRTAPLSMTSTSTSFNHHPNSSNINRSISANSSHHYDPEENSNDNDDEETETEGRQYDGRSASLSLSTVDDNEYNDDQTKKEQLLKDHKLRCMEVQKLLNAPVSSIVASNARWNRAKQLLQQLGLIDGDDYRALLLLDRLGKEEYNENNVELRLTNTIVDKVIGRWYFNMKKDTQQQRLLLQRSHSHNGSRRSMKPSKVYKIALALDRRIQLETEVFHKIIAATQYFTSSESMLQTDGPYLAERILVWMMDDQRLKHNPLIRPTSIAFTAAIQSWGYVSSQLPTLSDMAAEKALSLLRQLNTLYESGWGSDVMPTRKLYRQVMLTFALKGDGDTVESLLEEMYGLYLDQIDRYPHQRRDMELALSPHTNCFSLVLYAWSKSDDDVASERCEVILDRMLELEASGELENLAVDAYCFNLCMIAWARAQIPESRVKVQAVFDRMKELSKDSPKKAPTGASYVHLITNWAGHDPQKTEDIFDEWETQYNLGTTDMDLESELFERIMKAIYLSGVEDRAELCDRWIQKALTYDGSDSLFKLRAEVFNTAIRAWCEKKTLEGVQRAEKHFQAICDRHKSFFPGDPETAPTIRSYLYLIQCWATLGNMDRAEELALEWFTTNSSRRGNRTIADKLEAGLFNLCLKGWKDQTSKSNTAASRAERLLLSMDKCGVPPDAASFRHVLEAWSDTKKRQRRGWSTSYNTSDENPNVARIVALMDRSYRHGSLGGGKAAFLSLRQRWKLLGVE